MLKMFYTRFYVFEIVFIISLVTVGAIRDEESNKKGHCNCNVNNEINTVEGQYKPTWESLESRPLPSWYDKAKFGVFIHWGVYSVPAFGGEWFWMNWRGRGGQSYVNFMTKNYKPGFTYQDFGPQFTAEFFDPMQWAEIIKKSGAKYVVLTSKHHEGYTLWPSKRSYGWNSMDVGPHRDLVGELSRAVRSLNSTRFGLYHSLYEWFNPLWMQDKSSNLSTRYFVETKVLPELHEIVNEYKPEIIWSDGEWEAPADSYWDALNFLAWLYNESPVKDTVVVNDRWGGDTLCKHGGFLTCADRYQPGKVMTRKWENAMTIDKYSWGYRRNARSRDIYTTQELIIELVETVSFGGNILVNIGPTSDGVIPIVFEERLIEIGDWLSINGKSIFETTPWSVCQNDTTNPNLWFTQADKFTIYAIMTKWPKDNLLLSECIVDIGMDNISSITMLETQKSLNFSQTTPGIVIRLKDHRQKLASNHAWPLKIEIKH
ncbi:plasma alpha-L-fucosidase [Daktulosphaira vitifoliae]|uniref:plasma alpha-L-fucosidase n=1 Tax=Daktulosphaira vitifoliae TaxID=58002 RepID=UPI0021AAF121|nr:plasma alpha-L-fucosidase [Daktulosphaira vitifoliae]